MQGSLWLLHQGAKPLEAPECAPSPNIPDRAFPRPSNAFTTECSRTGISGLISLGDGVMLPIGNSAVMRAKFPMSLTPEEIGRIVRTTRRDLGVTQEDLALTSGTGTRFIIELEKGKPTCQIGKVLTVLQTLGIQMILEAPTAASTELDRER